MLGNKKNRSTFVKTLRATVEIDDPDPKRLDRKKRIPAHYNVFKLLDEASRHIEWNRARAEFETAVAEVKRLKKEITTVEELEVQVERLTRTWRLRRRKWFGLRGIWPRLQLSIPSSMPSSGSPRTQPQPR